MFYFDDFIGLGGGEGTGGEGSGSGEGMGVSDGGEGFDGSDGLEVSDGIDADASVITDTPDLTTNIETVVVSSTNEVANSANNPEDLSPFQSSRQAFLDSLKVDTGSSDDEQIGQRERQLPETTIKIEKDKERD